MGNTRVGKRSRSLFHFNLYLLPVLLFAFTLAACGTRSLSSNKNESGSMKNEKPTVVRYVALGDSTGVGVGARDGGYVIRIFQRIKRQNPSSSLTNLCVSGATSTDMLRDQLDAAIAARPTLVTIGIGINDVARGVTDDEYTRNLEAAVTRLKAETTAAIVISNLPDVSLAPVVSANMRNQLESRIQSFNQIIKDVMARHSIAVVDIYTTTHDLIPRNPEFFSADGFHPSDMGYEYWANLMWPTVQRAIEE